MTRSSWYGSSASGWKMAALFALLWLVGGCAAAPVQEMSDARQALMAAEQAGAEEHAPEQLAEARRLLDQASQNLADGSFNRARQEARQAKELALEALDRTEMARESSGRFEP